MVTLTGSVKHVGERVVADAGATISMVDGVRRTHECPLPLPLLSISRHRKEGIAMGSQQANVRIEASPHDVWRVLTDIDRYPTWNRYATSAVGELRVRRSRRAR